MYSKWLTFEREGFFGITIGDDDDDIERRVELLPLFDNVNFSTYF